MSEIGAAIIADTTARVVARAKICAMDRQTAAIDRQTDAYTALLSEIQNITLRVDVLEDAAETSS